uniref:NADH dehydrogenase subunit 4L n=1 Tax=Aeolothrips indicus TaxID=2856552 RepID=A0A8F5PMN1_9NEOP|nr:NADH dehydrogenase subunit 4L [Aeolothrips indicus]
MNNLIYMLSFSFFFVVLVFFFHFVNLMNLLLFMEVMYMTMYFVMCLYMGGFMFSSLLYFLIMGVCEGVMGLTYMIILMRVFGKVMMYGLDLSSC